MSPLRATSPRSPSWGMVPRIRSPPDFAPPPSPRRDSPAEKVLTPSRDSPTTMSTTSSTKGDVEAKKGAVVVVTDRPDESRSDGPVQSSIEVQLPTNEDSMERDMTYSEDDPAERRSEGTLSPLPLDMDNDVLMEMSDDLLQLPIAPVGPLD